MPFFSVIIPTYNRVHLIGKTIKSVLDQTFKNWELIVIDDGSTDNTKQVLQKFSDSRIRYIYQDNAERSAARNNGIKHATGEWICFLDSDDEYLSNHLAMLHKYILNEPEPALIATGIKRVSESGEQERLLPNPKTENILKEIWTTFLIPTQVCIHHSILQKEQFDERYRIWEDTHLFLRIAAQMPLKIIHEVTCIQHVHGGSTVEQAFGKVKLYEVKQYVAAIRSLRDHKKVMEQLSSKDLNEYMDSKYRMYLYAARKNGQTQVALKIWGKAMLHKPSLYLLSEFPKILINGLGLKKND